MNELNLQKSAVLDILKSNWAIITAIGLVTAQTLAVYMEVKTLEHFGVEYLSIAQLSDLPLILLRYPEMIMFVIYGGFVLYAINDVFELFYSRHLVKAYFKSVRFASTVVYLLCGLVFISAFWENSTPAKRSRWITNEAFPNVVLLKGTESNTTKCYGLITATSTHLVIYDLAMHEAITIQKSSIDYIRWPYGKVSIQRNGKCLVYESLEQAKQENAQTSDNGTQE